MTIRSWYTSGSDHLHLRIFGPPEPIWRFGMLLHERTPFLDRIFYPKEGLLFLQIDRRAKSWLHNLQHQQQRFSILHQRITVAPEIIAKYGGTAPFRLADIPVQPYQGEIGTLGLRSATLERGPLRYYRIIDTPTAEIAQQLAPFFPVYCFAAKTTQLTYVAISSQRLFHIQPALLRAFPALSINLRFDLPYESTSKASPIERLIHYEPYFSGTSQDTSKVLAQLLQELAH